MISFHDPFFSFKMLIFSSESIRKPWCSKRTIYDGLWQPKSLRTVRDQSWPSRTAFYVVLCNSLSVKVHIDTHTHTQHNTTKHVFQRKGLISKESILILYGRGKGLSSFKVSHPQPHLQNRTESLRFNPSSCPFVSIKLQGEKCLFPQLRALRFFVLC